MKEKNNIISSIKLIFLGKKAEIKLEKIKNFMVDFKSILDSCKYEVMMQ